MDYEQTIKILKKIADVDTIKELSDILDVNYATFNTWATRKEIPLKRIKEFSEKLGIDMNLITNPEMDNYKGIFVDVKEILDQWKSEQKLKTYKDLAIFLGVAPNTLDVWKQRGSIPPKNILKYIQMHSSIKSTNTISIRYFPDIYASAGFGNTNENENFQIINVDKTFLTEVLGVPYKTQYDMIKIYGESMEPFIQNGSFIIIDTTRNSLDKIRNGDVVIFRNSNNELFCKRILKNAFDDDIVISSDNFNFGDKKVKKSALKDHVFIGAVICSCNAKIFLNQIERV
ncbi:S24 family peptidase [Campylobacter jejuni]|nr:S24 family peptidase [Campylobacter jejuni]